jgi:hypothetical protein
MAGYVYKGTEPHKQRGAGPARRLTPWDPSRCGTNGGYHQHYRHKIPACDPCAAAHKKYDTEYRAKQKASGIRRTAKRQ